MSGDTPHQLLQPPGWKSPKGYANGVLAAPGCRLLSIAGQVAWDANESIVSPVLHEQFAQALQNVARILEEAGGRPEHLVRMTYYVVDVGEYRREAKQIGAHYGAIFGRHYPASTLVQVAELLEETREGNARAQPASGCRRGVGSPGSEDGDDCRSVLVVGVDAGRDQDVVQDVVVGNDAVCRSGRRCAENSVEHVDRGEVCRDERLLGTDAKPGTDRSPDDDDDDVVAVWVDGHHQNVLDTRRNQDDLVSFEG